MNLPTAQWRWDTAEQGGFLSAAEEDRLADVAERLAPEHDTFSGFVSAVNARIGNSVSPPPARALIEAQLRAGPAEEAA